MLIYLLDFISAAITVLVMWNHNKHRNWWLLYCVGSMLFFGLMVYKWVPFWAIASVIFFGVGVKNYLKGNK